jgi:hypothetical protein
MQEVIVKSINSENGTLYFQKEGRRITLAEVDATIEITEQRIPVRTLGSNAGVKKRHAVLAITFNRKLTREITEEFLSSVERFELKVELERADGRLESFFFGNIEPLDLFDLDFENQDWEFGVNTTPEQLSRLITL